MDSILKTENVYNNELKLFKDLLDCVVRESELLKDLNVENLWPLMDEKQRIMNEIEEFKRYKKKLNEFESSEPIPIENKRAVMDLKKKINELKNEVRVRVRENMTFIKDMLGFYDELIQRLVKAGKENTSYQPAGRAKKESSPLLYKREA